MGRFGTEYLFLPIPHPHVPGDSKRDPTDGQKKYQVGQPNAPPPPCDVAIEFR
jgi:hypothetical protein